MFPRPTNLKWRYLRQSLTSHNISFLRQKLTPFRMVNSYYHCKHLIMLIFLLHAHEHCAFDFLLPILYGIYTPFPTNLSNLTWTKVIAQGVWHGKNPQSAICLKFWQNVVHIIGNHFVIGQKSVSHLVLPVGKINESPFLYKGHGNERDEPFSKGSLPSFFYPPL
jgi:hypothetical protein